MDSEEKRVKIENLLRAFDIIAKKLLSYHRSGGIYLYFALLYLLYVFLVTIYDIVGLNNSFIYILAEITGVIGSTAYFIYGLLIVYKVNKHIEYTIYYHSHIEDLLITVKNMDREDLRKKLVQLHSIERVPIEYVLPLLIVPYLSVLTIENIIVTFFLLLLFAISFTLLLYMAAILINNHIVIENSLAQIIYGKLGINGYTAYEKITVSLLHLFAAIVTIGIYGIVLVDMLDNFMDKHVSFHRRNYTLFKMFFTRIKNKQET